MKWDKINHFLHVKNIQNWCHFLEEGTVCLYSFQNSYQKGPFSPQLDETKDQSEVEAQGPSDSRAIVGQD